MDWEVEFHVDFEKEFDDFPPKVQEKIYVALNILEKEGPSLTRPLADTLKGSNYANMKELRVRADRGVWRVAFAFDPRRKAILLAAANKVGDKEQLFYKRLIADADKRYEQHLAAEIRRK